MLTGMVNIAVFAAFHMLIETVLHLTAAFKPFCVSWQRDVSCYGWQKRQDVAKTWQWMARWAAKAARFGGLAAASTAPRERLPVGADGGFGRLCGCLRCWRREVAPWR